MHIIFAKLFVFHRIPFQNFFLSLSFPQFPNLCEEKNLLCVEECFGKFPIDNANIINKSLNASGREAKLIISL